MRARTKTKDFILWPPPKMVERTAGTQRIPKTGPKVCSTINPRFAPEAYELEITTRFSSVVGGSARGVEHGQRTLDQLRKQCPDALPCLRIVDEPDFPVRGFMLDISRGKVPGESALRELVRALASLKYNHLQLYTEHTFAFQKHKQVWQDADPMTANDLVQLQKLCDENHIELSANFNSFGHFERWLKHPQYKHLAECPQGFSHPMKGQVPHGTTLKPDAASLRFLDKLWAEYLPLFKSKRFNLGGDEPWELGQGWSKPLVKKHGKHRVYLDFLKKLHQLAAQHGKEMLFWADILLQSSESASMVPKDSTALLWGYESYHPFESECARLATARRKFWVCPGTSAWNTFTGRTDNMLANIARAAQHGLKYGAEGLLLTSWGDGGNHQPWPIMYPGIAYAAGQAWNRKGARQSRLARAVNLTFSQRADSGYGEILLQLGRVENAFTQSIPNRSRLYNLFFATRDELKAELATLPASELKKTAAALARAQWRIAKLGEKFLWEFRSAGELQLGADMAAWALRRAQFTRARKNTEPLKEELYDLIQYFIDLWGNRAREGGLREGVERMASVGREL